MAAGITIIDMSAALNPINCKMLYDSDPNTPAAPVPELQNIINLLQM